MFTRRKFWSSYDTAGSTGKLYKSISNPALYLRILCSAVCGQELLSV